MMSLETIKALAHERALEAAENGETPYVYWNADEVDEFDGFPFPFLGDYVPDGWKLVDRHFVDSSGFGAPDEPALTANQFIEVIKERIRNHSATGWAITEAGQFQVYVGEYRRDW